MLWRVLAPGGERIWDLWHMQIMATSRLALWTEQTLCEELIGKREGDSGGERKEEWSGDKETRGRYKTGCTWRWKTQMKGQTRTHLDTQEAHTNAMLKETTELDKPHTAQWTNSQKEKKNLHPPTDRYSIHTYCTIHTHTNSIRNPKHVVRDWAPWDLSREHSRRVTLPLRQDWKEGGEGLELLSTALGLPHWRSSEVFVCPVFNRAPLDHRAPKTSSQSSVATPVTVSSRGRPIMIFQRRYRLLEDQKSRYRLIGWF